VLPNIIGSVFWSEQSIDSIMDALIIQTGTSPEAIALWVTMKNYITVDQIDFNFETLQRN
jgi:hypothetical protein